MQPKMPNAKDEKAALLKEPIPYVYVKRCGTYYMEIESNAGITKRLNNLLENLDFRRENMKKELDIERCVCYYTRAPSTGGVRVCESLKKFVEK